MAYRRRTSGSRKFNERMARARSERERLRLDGPAPDYPPVLPEIRRRIVVEDYDSGEVVRHELVLKRSSRVDCYQVEVDGVAIKGRHGWSRVLELVRKSFLRIGNFY